MTSLLLVATVDVSFEVINTLLVDQRLKEFADNIKETDQSIWRRDARSSAFLVTAETNDNIHRLAIY